MNTWFKIDEKIRFLIIGSLNACISYIIYALICFLFGKEIYQLALVLAWVLSSVSSFFMQKLLVFQTKGNYLKEYDNKTQFIVITHKKRTMEYAGSLYGITMQESGVSKLVSVKLADV